MWAKRTRQDGWNIVKQRSCFFFSYNLDPILRWEVLKNRELLHDFSFETEPMCERSEHRRGWAKCFKVSIIRYNLDPIFSKRVICWSKPLRFTRRGFSSDFVLRGKFCFAKCAKLLFSSNLTLRGGEPLRKGKLLCLFRLARRLPCVSKANTARRLKPTCSSYSFVIYHYNFDPISQREWFAKANRFASQGGDFPRTSSCGANFALQNVRNFYFRAT